VSANICECPRLLLYRVGGRKPSEPRFLRRDGAPQADFRCLAAGFFAAVSFCFLPSIGISVSFWSAAALRGFFPAYFGALLSAAVPPTLRRSASIRSTTFSPRGRSFGVIGLPERLLLMRSTKAVS
jgi:hypothetical protein